MTRHGSMSFDDCVRLFATFIRLISSFFINCSTRGFFRGGGLLFDLAFLQTGHAQGDRGVLQEKHDQ